MHLITTLCLFSLAIVQANPLDVSIKNLEGKPAKLADHCGQQGNRGGFHAIRMPD